MDLPRLSGDVLGSDEFGGPFASTEFDSIAEEVLVITSRFTLEEWRLADDDVREVGELLVFGEILVLLPALPALTHALQAAAAGLFLFSADIGCILCHLLQEVLRRV